VNKRLWQTLAPIGAGLILDLVDFFTPGPFGLSAGFILGFLVTWLLTQLFDLPMKRRLLPCTLAGIYCTIPFTETIPVATFVMTLIRLLAPGPEKQK
jgi:hypothetical protein